LPYLIRSAIEYVRRWVFCGGKRPLSVNFMLLRFTLALLITVAFDTPTVQAQTDSTRTHPDSVGTLRQTPATYLTGITVTDSLQARINRKRNRIMAATSLLVLGSTYFYLENKWWSGGGTNFHFDDGRDWRYASNLDKVGHFYGGVVTADLYYSGFRWAGMPTRKAELYALGAAVFVQLSTEFKDGFALSYGFSWADVAAGTLGGLQPMLKNRSAFLRDSQFKASYWQRTTKYFNHRGIKVEPFSIDDYINITYWFSFSPRHFGGPKFRKAWPDWLQLSVGAGLDAETWSPTRNGEGGLWELYIAPDIDLVKLFKPRKPFMRSVLHMLNFVKVPMPTLQLGPKPRVWGMYF
jgi:hypothetical protein